MENTEIGLIIWCAILSILIIYLIVKQYRISKNVSMIKILLNFWYCRDNNIRDESKCGPLDYWNSNEGKERVSKAILCLGRNQVC